MISGLKQVHAIVSYQIHQPVFARNPSGPEIRSQVAKWLWFADPLKRIAHDRFDQIETPDGSLTIRVNPPAQVLEAFPLYDEQTLLSRFSFALSQSAISLA